MKRAIWTVLISTIVTVMLPLSGCAPSSPSQVVVGFISALRSGDLEKAVGYMTEQAQKEYKEAKKDPFGKLFVDMAEGIASEVMKTHLESFEVVQEEVHGTTATVVVRYNWKQPSLGLPDTETFRLVKENSEWKIERSS